MKNQCLSQFWCFSTLLFLTSLPFSTATATDAIQSKQPIDTTQYLLIQHGTKATIEHKTGEKTFTIVLQDVAPYVAYVSDRPNRKTGTMPIQEFLQFWKQNGSRSFKSDPPNAYFNAIEMGTSASEGIKDFSIELTNPQYDSQTKTLRYTALPLAGAKIPSAGILNYITLFIDDVCLSCW